jgi:hypothetical protein
LFVGKESFGTLLLRRLLFSQLGLLARSFRVRSRLAFLATTGGQVHTPNRQTYGSPAKDCGRQTDTGFGRRHGCEEAGRLQCVMVGCRDVGTIAGEKVVASLKI